MTMKDRLHELVDELPEYQPVAAQRFLEEVRADDEDPFLRALRDAPFDDEPLTDEDLADMGAAAAELRRGPNGRTD